MGRRVSWVVAAVLAVLVAGVWWGIRSEKARANKAAAGTSPETPNIFEEQFYNAATGKRYGLSGGTIKVLRNLEQDVTISYFDRTAEFTRAKDLLERYRSLSSKLSVAYVDPDRKPQIARAADVTKYGTIYVETGGRKEEAKSLTEEELTRALIRVLKVSTVCAVTGSGERSLDDSGPSGAAAFKQLLEKHNDKIRSISLLEKPEVPGDCSVLVVDGPKRDYADPAVNAVKSYVEGGGRALLLLDPPLKVGRAQAGENPALAKLLQEWGVTLNNDLVLEMSGVGQLFGLGPEAPLVSRYESQAIVREMKAGATVFPLVRSLDVRSTDRSTVEKLFQTSAESYTTTRLSSSNVRIDPKKDKKGPFTLGAAGTYNTGKPSKPGRFVVVGGSGWAASNVLSSRNLGNGDLLVNMIDWLSSDENLIAACPKEPANRRLSLSRRQRGGICEVASIAIPPAAAGGGPSSWWERR